MAFSAWAAAVQPVYRVDANTLFLHLDGVALNARNGHVAWRFPRYQGQTYTDGHGLLLLSWVSGITPKIGHRTTSICRIRTRDGKKLWCSEESAVHEWVVDASGERLYVHSPGRLEVLTTRDGRHDQGFSLHNDDALTMLPLPSRGLLLLERAHGQVKAALRYQPGAATLEPENVPAALYPFRSEDHGLLLYAKPKREFFLAAPFHLLFGRHDENEGESAVTTGFPRASLTRQGFIFTDWQGSAPVVRGGNYEGALWQAPRAAEEPKLAISNRTAVMLEPDGASSQLQGWQLDSGTQVFRETLPGGYAVLEAGGGVLVLQAEREVRLLDAASGAERWRVEAHEGALAAIAQSSIVFWEDGGSLIALARRNGALLWRVRFQSF
jgi:hypothetical protein